MSENAKTLSLAGAAVVAVMLVVLTRLGGASATTVDDTKTPFFADFKDPLAAKSMEIVEWDAAKGEPKVFRVAQVNGLWSIPSKLNYPADAQNQLAEAAGGLMDLEKLELVTNNKGEHAQYDVVDPAEGKPGQSGYGKKVVLEDAGGKKLAQFIIGKEVKGKPELRYIRVPGMDAVFITKVSPAKLSTSFADWIEPDLLKLNSWDIVNVKYDNYSVDEANRRIVPGEQIELAFSDKDSKWTAKALRVPDKDDPRKMIDQPLAENEELNTQRLNDMKMALDDLKIVDVRRKPEGLGQDLRAAEGMKLDDEAFMSLMSKGYIVAGEPAQLFSNEGEIIVRMKDGIYYVLRFGEIAADTEQAKEEEKPAGEGGEEKPTETKPKGANRYLFVTADFDPDAVPKPELQTVPGAPAGPEAPAAAADKPAEGEAANKPADEKPADDKPADPAAAERAKIEEENKRKQDEYDRKIKEGEEKKKKLNDRFADWYYVISDDTYRKIKLNRADFVQVKKPAGEDGHEGHEHDEKSSSGGLDEFHDIKREGLTPAAP